MSAQIQVCLDTLAFDQIEEIVLINGQPSVELTVYTPFSQYCFESSKPIKEFYEYVQHIQKHCFMLLSLDKAQIDLLQSVKDKAKTIIAINQLIGELLYRRDLITKQKTINLLGLNQQIQVYSQIKALIPNIVMGFKISDSNLTVSQMIIVNQFLVVTLENQSQLQKFGKIWNLIEPEIMGQMIVFVIGEATPFHRIFDKYYSFKLFCVENINDRLVVGTCQGSLIIYQITEHSIQEKTTIQVLTSPIYRIHHFNEEVYLVTDSQVKILDRQNFDLIGGGSLKNRLQAAWISCLNFDDKEKLLFLGTSQGFILVYKRTEKLEYLNQINFNVNTSIKSIQIMENYLYPCTENGVAIIQMKYMDNQFQYQEKTAFASQLKLVGFKRTQSSVFGFTQCGLLVQWNPENGQMNQAYKVDKNCLFGLQKSNSIFIVTSEQMIHIVNFQ
ncbi:unnamed protein product (macronuclear) [Paramecium tetraurelia]|uniref:Uncharacterized protein n=1 Tax=Paramecium tetraurelia TaxID=5888 RepID=A0DY05_PARTE|nr:uncharacterized protein GSPATT00021546001 [Paramecium tetraurelia]CAK87922.1 unnamed protein product [Paramecium tetraurelia]|eukprot:XP_001455319.1 hypothetical protein (macronuclear) [Paramecium tetraurelia strain d4-2]